MTVNLTGTENLPPILPSMLGPSYNYHAHELTCEPCEDGYKYKYSVSVSKVPLNNTPSEGSTRSTRTTTKSSKLTSDTKSVKYRIKPVKCSKSVRCVMMIQIKFILLHKDKFGNKVQSMFNEELSTDETLYDVIMGFKELCVPRMIKNAAFNPRMSVCVGEVTRQNSRPVYPDDLPKKISSLAEKSISIGRVTFIADTMDFF